MTLSIKIKKIRSSILNLTQSEFAKELGFTRIATISDYEKGKRAPNITTLRKIAKLGDVTIDWLTSEDDHVYDNQLQVNSTNKIPNSEAYINVGVYRSNIEDLRRSQPKTTPIQDFIIPKKYYKKNAITIRFDGDSMSPTILDGAIVGINKAEKRLTSGKLFALWIKHEGLTIRRVFVFPDRIELVPDNSNFPTTELKIREIDDNLIVGTLSWIFQGM